MFPEKIFVAFSRRKIFFSLLLCLLATGFFPVEEISVSKAQTEEIIAAPAAVRYTENFDNVAAPQLPANWTVTSTGSGAGFVTTNSGPDTAPNAVFTANPSTTSSSDLTSPPIYISSANTLLNFRHKYAMENTWDGGILEISIGAGAFKEITEAGGSFVTGGYNNFLNDSTNPIGNRFAWTGATPGTYITTSVQLPPEAFRQFVRFRWRFGSNDNFGADGWWIDSISLETISTGSNETTLTVPASGAASPYPSEIQISGMRGFVTGIIVDLGNFSHAAPDDVDVLLVAPNGRSVVLMSDAGGSAAVSNIALSFDDGAFASLPDNAPLTSDSYKPTNYEPNDAFPAPAPPNAPSVNSLGGFYGSQPNGAWKLYVVDDSGANAGGTIAGGWSLTLQSSVTACQFDLSNNGQAFPGSGGAGNFQVNAPGGCGWTATSNTSFVSINSGASGEGTSGINFTVAPNASGAPRTASIFVTNGVLSRTFLVQQDQPGSVDPAKQFDFDGDNKADLSVFRNGNWYLQQSSAGFSATQFGLSGDRIAPADYDGDRKTDIAVFRSGNWYVLQSSNNIFRGIQWGQANNDTPVPADYDGDSKADFAVWRTGTEVSSPATFYVLYSATGAFAAQQFGTTGTDKPLPADYDGDGKADYAVYREAGGVWYILQSSNSQLRAQQFGLGNFQDLPEPRDYDGDRKTDLGVFRKSNGTWYLLKSAEGFTGVQFGISTDTPVPADYDGDGKADIAVFRGGDWYLLRTQAGFGAVRFGLSGDVPVPAVP